MSKTYKVLESYVSKRKNQVGREDINIWERVGLKF